MKIIVGLGNPGEKYQNTRHNLGFMVLDFLLGKIESVEKTFWEEEKKNKALTKEVNIAGEKFVLAKPLSFMNDSGFVVSYLINRFRVKPEDIILIHDDVDLPIGKIRVRFAGGSGGHKGVQSVIDCLSNDKFLRIRLGVGKPMQISQGKFKIKKGVDEYVLSDFGKTDKGKVKQMINQTTKIVYLIAEHGIDKYLSKHNGKV